MIERLKFLFGEEWFTTLEPFLLSTEFQGVNKFINSERQKGKVVYPEQGSDDNFRNYRLTQPSSTKVVIIADHIKYDSYFDGIVWSGSKLIEETPFHTSLFNSINSSYPENLGNLKNGLDLMDLSRWASQGVFMLTKEPTYVKNSPFQHVKLWNFLVVETIKALSKKPNLIWVLVGEDNWIYDKYISILHQKVRIQDYSRNAETFNGLFYNINEYLNAVNKKSIIW